MDLEYQYLEDGVDPCEVEGDPCDWNGWYRNLLLRDDNAIAGQKIE